MELSELIRLAVKHYKFLIVIAVIAGLAGAWFAYSRPTQYEGSVSFTINRINTAVTTEYQYDGYYGIKAAELFGQTVVSWLETPSVLLDMYQRAGVEPHITSLSSFTGRFRAKIYSPQTINHDEVLICDSIYENLQHSDFFGRQYDTTNWYFKPMLRVDTSHLNSLDSILPIFKIKFFTFNGIELQNYEKIIYAYNFKHGMLNYDGKYINKFFEGTEPINITVPSGLTTGLNTGREEDLSACKIDFKIYTYGYADLYFDKLTVDCKYANQLFNNEIEI